MSNIKKRAYISGPMSGIKDFNYPAFNAEARRLRAMCYDVENPAENEKPEFNTWDEWMRLAIAQLIKCDTVVTLHGWEMSRGAKIEVRIAKDLGMDICKPSDIRH